MKRVLAYAIVFLFIAAGLAWYVNNQSNAKAARLTEEVTFSKQIARLMQNHCQRCHQQDGHAPFPLTTYKEAYPYARSIKSAVVSRRMPHGVFAARLGNGCGDVDTFEGPRRLLDSEIAMIAEWVDAGAPEGDPKDMPPPIKVEDNHYDSYGEWHAGEPDLKIDNGPGGFRVPAQLNKDFFRRFPIKTNFEADRYFTSFEALVGTGDLGRQINVVHHVTLFIDPTCGSIDHEKRFAASNPEIPGRGFEGEFTYPTELVGMWFPGTNPIVMASGIGVKVPRGACLIMEVHYTTWQPEVVMDVTTVGIRWARNPIYYERLATRVNNENFVIPAGAKHYEVNAIKTFDDPITIYSMAPHMHQFGVDFITEALLPNGEKKCLIDVEYDFKHQGNYLLKQPIRLPAGTKINVRAFYDNTADFPRQLYQPPKDIPFGPVSDKEMCQVTIGLTRDSQLLHPSSPTIWAIRMSEDRLLVTGSDLRPGAEIEVNGKLLADTRIGLGQAYVFSPADWQEFAEDKTECCCASKASSAKAAGANPLSYLLNLSSIQSPGLASGCSTNLSSCGTANQLQGMTASCNCNKSSRDNGKPLKIAVVNPDGGRSETRSFFLKDEGEGRGRVGH